MSRIDRKKLKRDISEKFGNLTRFARAYDMNYDSVLRILNSPKYSGEEIEDLLLKYQSYDVSDGLYDLIGDNERRKIRMSILMNFKNYTEFCDEHSQFDVVYISNIVNGKLTTRTTKFGNLIDVLTQNYNYENDKLTTQVQ